MKVIGTARVATPKCPAIVRLSGTMSSAIHTLWRQVSLLIIKPFQLKGNAVNTIKWSLSALLLCLVGLNNAIAQQMDQESQESFDVVMGFMGAMGSGDMEKMSALMADDMVWHNEGDTSLPWIGETKGKEEIFKFLGVFTSNLKTTLWENSDAFALGDTVAVFGKMNSVTTKSGKETGEFTFALRAKVKDGKVSLWHWFEDSFAVSQAYHGK